MNPVTRAWRWQQDQMAQGGQYASTIAMKGLGAMLLIDVVIPVATYYLFRAFDQSQTARCLWRRSHPPAQHPGHRQAS